MTAISLEAPHDVAAREALLDLCMGPDRKLKSSERLRAGRRPSDGLAFSAHGPDGRLAGTVRLWDVETGDGRAALLLGPLAVHPWFRARGLGGDLMRAALAAAEALGHGVVILVGDAPYYARFGFSAARTSALEMPGYFARERLLARELAPGALDGAHGLIRPSGVLLPAAADPAASDLAVARLRAIA